MTHRKESISYLPVEFKIHNIYVHVHVHVLNEYIICTCLSVIGVDDGKYPEKDVPNCSFHPKKCDDCAFVVDLWIV